VSVSLFPAVQAPEETVAPDIQLNSSDRRLRWFELALVLLLTVGGSVISAVATLKYGPSIESSHSNLRWVASGFHEILGLILLGYVLRRHGRRFTTIGLRWSWRDIAAGVALIFVSYVVYRIGGRSLWLLHHALFGTFPHPPRIRDLFGRGTYMMLLQLLVNPFYEELVVRAYLMTEVIELTGSTRLAVLLSVAVQTSYHLYYGWWTALALGIQFLVFSLYFARWRRALPLVIAHGFYDIQGFIHLL
jgi:membrane protease YdiL (CAAX protease family)